MDTVRVFFPQLIFVLTIRNGHALFSGSRALPGQFPYMAAVMKPGCLVCSGAVISIKHILTAAHCFDCVKPKRVFILVGQTNIADQRRLLPIETIHQHEAYYSDIEPTALVCLRFLCSCIMGPPKEPRPKHDIAIATLANSLDYGNYVTPVDLPDSMGLDFCEFCDFAGWGQSSKKESFSEILRWALFEMHEPRECEKLGQPADADDGEFCAVDLARKSVPGNGDSGAPLVCRGTVVGVLSMSYERPDRASLFAQVYAHIDFINKIVYGKNN